MRMCITVMRIVPIFDNQKHLQMNNRNGHILSLQVSKMGEINDLTTADFSLQNDTGFLIKNDEEISVELDVTLLGMEKGEFVFTKFKPGWNPELVKCVKQNLSGMDLKYGY